MRSRIRTIIEHLLKLEHLPAQDPRGVWYDTIITQRGDLVDELTPSIRRAIEPEFAVLCDRARAAVATSLRKQNEPAADALPADCPYSLDQVTGDWWP